MNKEALRVPLEKLRHTCSPDILESIDTSATEPLKDFIGQDRAIEALKFGLEIESHGYNIVVTGFNGTGRQSAIKEHLRRFAEERKNQGNVFLHDFCFVFNFANPDEPKILIFKNGDGKKFQNHLEEVMKTISRRIPAVFQSNDYVNARNKIKEEASEKAKKLSEFLQGKVKGANFGFAEVGMGQVRPAPLSLDPTKPGEVMSDDEFENLLPDDKEKVENNRKKIFRMMEKVVIRQKAIFEEAQKKIEDLEKEKVKELLEPIFEASEYQDYPEVVEYFAGCKDCILNNFQCFKPQESNGCSHQCGQEDQDNGEGKFVPFKVNLLVDNSGKTEPPIIFENHPNFSNLFGRIEKKFFQGGFFTDHTMLKAGSLCLADGGYLIVNLLDVLMEPGVWQKLKRVLKSGVLRIEELSEYFGFPASISLKPADIPINVKVIAITDINLFNLLTYFDEEFLSVFKVKAEFNHEMEANGENLSAYAGFIAFCCQRENLLPFDKTAVAKMAEFGIRIASNQKKISTQFGKIKNLVIEASYWAKKDEAQAVRAEHVEKALKEKIKRTSLLHEKSQESIIEGTLLIDTKGNKIGHVNGLVVYEMGDLWFGRPSKVTCKTYIGKEEGIISIEREVKFSGPISDKATFILKGYLASKYAQDKPFSLSGILCFEQSYGPIEGDSASIAELAVIISSISKIPIYQSFAVTGSMNQDGDVQPIGGVNDKIEGFFDVCEKRGLTGEQGVVIPYRNINHLMLREDVVEAIKNHQFHIYAAKTANEAMELLMDREIKDIDDAVNDRIREAMKIISETLHQKK